MKKRSASKSSSAPIRRALPIRRTTSSIGSPSFGKKFNNSRCQYNGSIYDSRKEAAYAQELDIRKHDIRAEFRVVEWKRQVKVSLDVNGKHIANYFCDFLVTFADGREEWHEVKGFATEVWRLKEKLFRAIYPDRILKVIR